MLGNFAHFFVLCQFIKIKIFIFFSGIPSVSNSLDKTLVLIWVHTVFKSYKHSEDKTGQWEEWSYMIVLSSHVIFLRTGLDSLPILFGNQDKCGKTAKIHAGYWETANRVTFCFESITYPLILYYLHDS